MADFGQSLKQQFEEMKQLISSNAPSATDSIPIGPYYRLTLLMRHKMLIKQNMKTAQPSPLLSLQTNSDPISCKHLCLKPENTLQNIKISNLAVNQINFNKKLTVTVLSECVQMVGVSVIIEDAQQNVLVLALYNLAPLRSASNELSNLLPIGTTLIIKEPYVKKTLDGNVSIRVDNIHSNLIVKHPNNPKYFKIKETNPQKLKQIGNDYFKKKMYDFAVRYYSDALTKLKKLNNNNNVQITLKLLTNRSLCYLKLNKYVEAVHDAQKALHFDKESIKIRYRLATALTGVRKHEEALTILNYVNTNKINSNSIQKEFKLLKDRISRRLLESKEFYQIKSMTWKQLNDIEDYYSSSMKIKYINNKKGRGVVATKNISKNEVILSEKCMTFGHIDKDRLSALVDHRTNTAYMASTINLIQNIVNIYRNGSDIDKYKISLLHKGGKYTKKDAIIPKMKLFKIDLIPNNVNNIPILNIEEIRNISTKNIFTMPTDQKSQKSFNSSFNKSAIERKRMFRWETGSGLFIVASFFNHSDNPNVQYDMNYKRIHMTAKRNIKKGEELCIRYSENVQHWIDN